MEPQTPPASQSIGGYPSSATGGNNLPATPENLRSGAWQEVPDALSNPVTPAAAADMSVDRFAIPRYAKTARGGPPILGIVVGVVLLVIIVLAFATGFFGLL
jgi:hypothetical protein